MPSNIASESNGKGGRHADMSAVHRKEATTKFCNGYDDNAKYHHNTLKAQNKNRPFKPGTLDHYLLLTFFPEIKNLKADAAPKASKSTSKNADKASAAGKADASKAAPSESSSSSGSSDEDPSVRQVEGSKPVQDLEQRAAKDDAPAPAPAATISDILTDPDKWPNADIDADTLLGAGNPDEDTPENNAKIAEEAHARISKNRVAAAVHNAAKARRSSASGEVRPGASGRKRRPADESDSSSGGEQESRPIATKSRRTSRKSREPVVVDSESEEECARKSRFTKRANCTLLSDFAPEIDKIRPHVQRMFLQRDGAELREGSVHRILNFHAILSVAGATLSRENFKLFKKACMNSFEDQQDA